MLSISAHDLIIAAATATFLNYTIASANIQDFVKDPGGQTEKLQWL